MNRREFGMTGTAAIAAAAALSSTAFAQQKSGSGPREHEGIRSCAQACSNCQRECDHCATHCGHMLVEGKKDHLDTLMSCRDCAIVCASASQIVSGQGPFSTLICETCATACADCAKSCEKFSNDTHMKACAEECRRCEKACREMLKRITSA